MQDSEAVKTGGTRFLVTVVQLVGGIIGTREVRIVSLEEIWWKFKGSLQDQRSKALGSEQ